MKAQDNSELKLTRLGEDSLAVLNIFARGSLLLTAEVMDFALEVFEYKSIHQAINPSRVRAITKRLERAGLLFKDKETSGNGGYKLTQRGHWELARHRYKDNPEHHVPHKWDNKWRVVIFDIPELAKKERNILRRAILGYGMYQLQKSVWVYPYPCDAFIRSIQEDLGFSSEVLYMLVDKIDNQKELEREFALK